MEINGILKQHTTIEVTDQDLYDALSLVENLNYNYMIDIIESALYDRLQIDGLPYGERPHLNRKNNCWEWIEECRGSHTWFETHTHCVRLVQMKLS